MNWETSDTDDSRVLTAHKNKMCVLRVQHLCHRGQATVVDEDKACQC